MERVKIVDQEDDYTESDIVVTRYDDIDKVVGELGCCAGVLPPIFTLIPGYSNDKMGWIARACSSLQARQPRPVYVPILVDNVKEVAKYLNTFYDGGFRHFYLPRYYGRYLTENLLSFINHVVKDDAHYLIHGGDIEPVQTVERGKWSWCKNGNSSQEVP